MSERAERSMDQWLAQSLPLDPDYPVDDGFSALVVRRIRRRRNVRRMLLGTAAVAGALLAVEPAWNVIAAVGIDAETLVSQWSGTSISPAYGQAATAGSLALLALLFTRALEG